MFGSEICEFACEKGAIKCLKYLHKEDIEWDKTATLAAARKGNLDCLTYAVRHGCPIDIERCVKSTRKDEIKKYLESLKE